MIAQVIEVPKGRKNRAERLKKFAESLLQIKEKLDFKMSSRDWCYYLEGDNLITKAQFDLAQKAINICRKRGLLPVDFVISSEKRMFHGLEYPTKESPEEYIIKKLENVLKCERYYTPDWWEGEEYYCQILVEKIGLRELFKTVCKDYHIPIATSGGWNAILEMAEMAERFKDAEDRGLKPLLLYCGDFDPSGILISDKIRKILNDYKNIKWSYGTDGYSPSNLIIERFGLNYDYITNNDLTWIDNLITGSKKNLADPKHPDHKKPYVQNYIKKYGIRKVEANAIMKRPEDGRELCRRAIEKYLGKESKERFKQKKQVIKDEISDIKERTGLNEAISKVLEIVNQDSSFENES